MSINEFTRFNLPQLLTRKSLASQESMSISKREVKQKFQFISVWRFNSILSLHSVRGMLKNFAGTICYSRTNFFPFTKLKFKTLELKFVLVRLLCSINSSASYFTLPNKNHRSCDIIVNTVGLTCNRQLVAVITHSIFDRSRSQ